jgi:hypothetical protein
MSEVIMSESKTGASPSCRQFYTDPLAAAWMAKHFGMRFTACWLGPGPQREYECMPDDWHFEVHDNRTGRYYIHPDSLSLLEPRKGDLVSLPYGEYGIIESLEENGKVACGTIHGIAIMNRYMPLKAYSARGLVPAHESIIQRDGKPFFWPEREVE